eukprot:g5528.t1
MLHTNQRGTELRDFVRNPGADDDLASQDEENAAMPLTKADAVAAHTTLCFESIQIEVDVKAPLAGASGSRGLRMQRSKVSKVIVHDASGVVQTGELLAIMGPSGAGKSSLLDVLAGRKTVGRWGGAIRMNGHDVSPKVMRQLSSYVAQEDTLMPTMTVRETFRFIADLQMAGTTPTDRAARVEKVVRALGLAECADTKVGGGAIRGISGGQRRRVSIGVEMLTSTRVLFLDEPTSGLDSAAALSLFKVLTRLAKTSGALVVATIHQPRSDIFAMFDQLLLMARGRVAFQGGASEAREYFEQQQRPCPLGWNVADHVIDVIAEDGTDGGDDAGASAADWAARFAASPWGATVARRLRDGREPGARVISRTKRKKTAFAWQTRVIARRCLVDAVRNPFIVGQQVFGYVLGAVALGLLFSQIKTQVAVQLALSFAFVVAIICIFCFFSVPVYVQGRALFAKEYVSGYFRLPSFVLANLIVSTSINVVVVTIYTAILHALQGWSGEIGGFVLVNVLLMLTLVAVNEFIGSLCSSLFVALALSALVSVIFILFAGVICWYQNMPPYLRWLFWCSPCSYATAALIHHNFNAAGASAKERKWLTQFDSPVFATVDDVPFDLFAFFVVFRLACFWSLKYRQKESR